MKANLRLLAFLMVSFGLLIVAGCEDDNAEKPAGELKAKIDLSGVNFITDLTSIDGRRIKAGQSITLSDDSDGNPDQWEWTFSDGQSEKNTKDASVTWADAVGEVTITLTVTRSSDGATDSDEVVIQVGPVEMLNRAVFGFEDQEADFDAVDKWYSWTPNTGTVNKSLETTSGANGTSQSIKVDVATNYGELQLRPHENAPEFLVSLESNTTYVFSFYMKASQALTFSEVNLLNVKNDDPKEGWYTPLWTGDAAIEDPSVTTNWKKFTYEFTTADLATFADVGYADGTADNAGPFFKHFASISGALTLWIDEISLKEKEQN